MSERKGQPAALTQTQLFTRWLWRGIALPVIAVLVVSLLSVAYFSWEFCDVCYQFHIEFSAVELSVFSVAGIVLGLAPTYQGLWHTKLTQSPSDMRGRAIVAWIIGVLFIVPIIAVYLALELISGPHPV